MDEKQKLAAFEQWWLEIEGYALRAERFTTPEEGAKAAWLACYQHLAPQWQPIETAPKDGTPILAWNEKYGARETRWELYREGSLAFSWSQEGKGPDGAWRWAEPQNNWGSSWAPTHWMPLPAAPDAAREQEKKTC